MAEADPTPPARSADVIMQALNDLMPSVRRPSISPMSRIPGPTAFSLNLPETPRPSRGISKPMPVYSVRLSDAAQGRSAELAELVGWRHVVRSDEFGEERLALADVREQDGQGKFANLRRGPWAAATVQALKVTSTAGVPGQEYAPAVLEIPAVMTTAIWMRASDDLAHVFIPFSPGQRELRPMRREEFDKWVSELARQQQAIEVAPEEQPEPREDKGRAPGQNSPPNGARPDDEPEAGPAPGMR